jgi:hypothetical protein
MGLIVFAGPARELPTPPSYSLSDTSNHCANWGAWLKRQPKMFAVDPTFLAGLTSGSDDLVVIKAVKEKVFRRAAAGQATLIQCTYGAGGNPGYHIALDTARQNTEFRSETDDTYHEMPPGSITLHGLDHETATINFVSLERYLYEGMISLTADVNGKEQTLQIGSAETPLRWTMGGVGSADGFNKFLLSLGDGYDWNPTRQRWVKVAFLSAGKSPDWAPGN